MKKLICLLLLLTMTAFCAVAENPFYTLQEWNDETLLGETTAVPIEENTLICAQLLPKQDGSCFVVLDSDGTERTCNLISEKNGLMTFVTEADVGNGYQTAQLTRGKAVVFGDEDPITTEVTGTVSWKGMKCGLVEASGICPGDVVSDMNGAVSGFVCAFWGQGIDRMAVLPVTSFHETDPWTSNVQTTVYRGYLILSWGGVDGWNTAEPVYLYYMDTKNDYYSTKRAPAGDSYTYFQYVPGRTYAIRLSNGAQDPDEPQSVADGIIWTAPAVEDYTEYDFSSEAYVGWLPAGTDESDTSVMVPRGQKITVKQLESGEKELFLQAIDHYTIQQTYECALTIAIEDEEGRIFWMDSGYIFMPDLAEDPWKTSITALFKDALCYAEDSPAGTYTVTCYIDGKRAATATFTLEEE